MKRKTKFPKEIYVKRESAGDGETYLLGEADPAAFAELHLDVEVGVYQLVGIATIKTNSSVVSLAILPQMPKVKSKTKV